MVLKNVRIVNNIPTSTYKYIYIYMQYCERALLSMEFFLVLAVVITRYNKTVIDRNLGKHTMMYDQTILARENLYSIILTNVLARFDRVMI